MSIGSPRGTGPSTPTDVPGVPDEAADQPFRQLFEQTNAGFAETDLTGRFLRVNDRYCEIVGRSAEALAALRIADITHPEDLPRNVELFGELAAGGRANFSMEKRYVRPDGSAVWVSLHVAAVRDAGGVVRSIVAAVGDITDRKRTEAAIRESEQRYRTLFTSIHEGFALKEAVCDDTGRIVDFRFVETNPAFEEQSGLSDVLGRTMREVVPGIESWIERFARVVESGEPLRFQERAAPLRKWFQVFAVRIGDPAARRIAVLFSDITEQKRAEQALREREERLRLIVESLTEYAIITLDTDGIVSGWNAGAANLLGYDADEIVGRGGDVIFTSEDRAANAPGKELRIAREEGRAINERWHVRKDGSRFWGSGVVKPLLMPDDEVIGFVKIMRDMTAEREHAEQLAIADRRKDEFLATLAHELRNPLAPMTFALETMKLAPDDKALTGQARETMERQVAHMVRLIDDLLDIGRITRDKLELRTERTDLRSIVEHAVEATRPAFGRAGHDLRVELPDAPVVLRADVARLTQVFGNLLANACKYTPAGGHITLAAAVEGRDAVVTVEDDGIGIAPDVLPRIFDMFVQADSSYEQRSRGLGIGLTLVRRLVDMHGGSVSASSEGLGRGSVFTVRLPLSIGHEADAEAEAGRVPETEPSPRAAVSSRGMPPGVEFLIVDDNRDSTAALATLLEAAGHSVEAAYDGRSALDKLAARETDVVLLDIGLPDLNGYDVCRRIRRGQRGRRVVIVALTGWGQVVHREESAEAGFDAHLVKPVRFDTLIETLEPLLPRDAG
ncbi:MAG: PAS domain S-box protein [Gammaproteobacteria bacterium]|nr:PAS domain S-box protein [Gammaproteobacteria bacterium]